MHVGGGVHVGGVRVQERAMWWQVTQSNGPPSVASDTLSDNDIWNYEPSAANTEMQDETKRLSPLRYHDNVLAD